MDSKVETGTRTGWSPCGLTFDEENGMFAGIEDTSAFLGQLPIRGFGSFESSTQEHPFIFFKSHTPTPVSLRNKRFSCGLSPSSGGTSAKCSPRAPSEALGMRAANRTPFFTTCGGGSFGPLVPVDPSEGKIID